MKRSHWVLLIFCMLFNNLYVRSQSRSIDSLIKYGVITIQEHPLLVKEFRRLKNEGVNSDRVAVLGALENAAIKKTFHIDPHKTDLFYSYKKGPLDSKMKDSINMSLRLLLEKIKKADLLTDRVYTHTLKNIDSSLYIAELQMIGDMAEMSSRLEWMAPSRLLPILEELNKAGVVSDTSFLRSKDDINNGKIESAFQLNGYCKYDKILDMTKYPDDPAIWIEQLHRDIASILPGLNFTDLSYIEIPDTSFSIPGVKVKVSLTCNGRIYKYTSLPFSNYKDPKNKITPKNITVLDLYRIFNKVLTDQGSPYRIHNVMFSHNNDSKDNKRFALIALKAEQGDVFMQERVIRYMLVSMDGYDDTLTSAKIDSTIAGWKSMGLFAHLSNEETVKAIDNAQSDYPFSTNNLLSNFPGVTYNLRDALSGPRLPYSNLLVQLAKITHGQFRPAKITQTKIGKGIKLRYLSKGRVHIYTFRTTYGWLDNKFGTFMRVLSKENALPGSFYQLLNDDAVIYLTKQQYNYASSNKLLSFIPANKGTE